MLPLTKAALVAYDADKPRRDAIWDAAHTAEALAVALAEDKAAADKVREAFAAETRGVNSREHAFLVHPDDPWLRTTVEKFNE